MDASSEDSLACKILVGGLSLDTSEHSLTQFYSKWGAVVACYIPIDPQRKQSKCFGFVTFESAASAALCLSNLPHVIDGHFVDAKWFSVSGLRALLEHSTDHPVYGRWQCEKIKLLSMAMNCPFSAATDDLQIRVHWLHNCSKVALRSTFSTFGIVTGLNTFNFSGRSGMFAEVRFATSDAKRRALDAVRSGNIVGFHLTPLPNLPVSAPRKILPSNQRPHDAKTLALAVTGTRVTVDPSATSFVEDRPPIADPKAAVNASSLAKQLPQILPVISPEQASLVSAPARSELVKTHSSDVIEIKGEARKRISAGLALVLTDVEVKQHMDDRLQEQKMLCAWRVCTDVSSVIVTSSCEPSPQCAQIAQFIVSYVSKASIFIGLKRKAAGESPEFSKQMKSLMAEAKGAIQIVTALNTVYVVGKQDEAKAWLKKIQDYLDNLAVTAVPAATLPFASNPPSCDKSALNRNKSGPAQAASAKSSSDLTRDDVRSMQLRDREFGGSRSRVVVDPFAAYFAEDRPPIAHPPAAGNASSLSKQLPRIRAVISLEQACRVSAPARSELVKPQAYETTKQPTGAIEKPMTAFASAIHKAAARGVISAPGVALSGFPRTLPLQKKAHKHILDEENRPFSDLLDVDTVKAPVNRHLQDWFGSIAKDHSDLVPASGLEFRIVGKPNSSTTEELMLKISKALPKLVALPALLANAPKTSDWYAKGADGVCHAFGKRDAVFLEYLFGRVQKQNAHGAVTIDFARFKAIVGRHAVNLLRQTDLVVPLHWISAADDVIHCRVDLQPSSPEYLDILATIEQTNTYHRKVLKIQRIENRPLYQQYLIQKGKVTRNCPKHFTVERDLFHGTSNEHLAGICEDGFDRSRAVSFGGKRFGAGSYFSTRFDYSSDARYAKYGYILYCKVLVGESTPGHPELKILPQKPSGAKYDSAVDSLIDPSIFVVFSDNHAFPAYLITLAQDVLGFQY